MKVPLPEYAPDRAFLDMSASDTVSGVYPERDYYLPVPALDPFEGTTALVGAPLGYFKAKSSAGTTTHFAAANDGADDRIYYYDTATAAWVDCSQAGGYGAADVDSGWRFAQYGDYVYAASGLNNEIQKISLTALGSGFADVAGTGGTAPPRARYITVVKENVLLGSLSSSADTIQWSEFGDADGWRIGQNGCDSQQFPDSGAVTGITGGEIGTVFQSSCYRRMLFSPGSPFLYEFQRVAENHGAPAPGSIVAIGTRVFWLAGDGFWMDAGQGPQPIGRGRVDATFLAAVRVDTYPQIVGLSDPTSTRILWAYPTSSQSDPNVRNEILVYDYVYDRWSLIETDVTYICAVEPPPLSLDSAGADTMDDDTYPSLDSPLYRGGEAQLGGFSTAFKFGPFSGANLEATVTTALSQPTAPGRTRVVKAMPLVDASTAYVSASTRPLFTSTDTWSTERSASAYSGYGHINKSAKFVKLKLRIPAGQSWSKAEGFEATLQPEGTY